LLLSIKEYDPEGLWDELGKSKTMQQVVRDPKRRWIGFIKSGKYKQVCNQKLVSEIDVFRKKANFYLVILASLGLMIFISFGHFLNQIFSKSLF